MQRVIEAISVKPDMARDFRIVDVASKIFSNVHKLVPWDVSNSVVPEMRLARVLSQ